MIMGELKEQSLGDVALQKNRPALTRSSILRPSQQVAMLIKRFSQSSLLM